MLNRATYAALLAVLVALVAAGSAAATVERSASCDGKTAQRHVERGRALVSRGYSLNRLIDPAPMKGSEKRALREHKFCVTEDFRPRIARYRERMAARYERHLFKVAPWLSPEGKHLVKSQEWALRAIRSFESGGDYQAVDASGTYGGAYQFDAGTWASVGGHGWPGDASPVEQDYRAALLRSQRGSQPWPVCGA